MDHLETVFASKGRVKVSLITRRLVLAPTWRSGDAYPAPAGNARPATLAMIAVSSPGSTGLGTCML